MRKTTKIYRESEVWPEYRQASSPWNRDTCEICDKPINPLKWWVVCESGNYADEEELAGCYCSEECANEYIQELVERRWDIYKKLQKELDEKERKTTCIQ